MPRRSTSRRQVSLTLSYLGPPIRRSLKLNTFGVLSEKYNIEPLDFLGKSTVNGEKRGAILLISTCPPKKENPSECDRELQSGSG